MRTSSGHLSTSVLVLIAIVGNVAAIIKRRVQLARFITSGTQKFLARAGIVQYGASQTWGGGGPSRT